MIVLISITLYLVNIFISRWMNKYLYQRKMVFSIDIVFWFIPIVTILGYLIIYFIEGEFEKNWFTGKNW
jgi:sugar phosphate permease